MLIGKLTKEGTGIIIQGDYYDLESLRTTLYALAEPFRESSFEMVQLMALAFEIRKANQGCRETEDVTPSKDETKIVYKCTSLILIDFLTTLSVIGQLLTKRNKITNECHLADIYSLMRVTKSVLNVSDSTYGLSLFNSTQLFMFGLEKYAMQLLEMAICEFLKTPKETRFISAEQILTDFFFDKAKKKEALGFLVSEAEKLNCMPEEIEIEWPDISW